MAALDSPREPSFTTPSTRPTGNHSSIHWYSVLQFGGALLAVFGLWSTALMTGLMGVIDLFNPDTLPGNELPMMLTAASMIVSGLLLIPVVYYALSRLVGWRPGPALRLPVFLHPGVLILTLPVIVGLGHLVSGYREIAWLVLPGLHILAIGLPVYWLLHLGQRGLALGSPQRRWGVFGSGLVLSPALIMMTELIALLGFVVLGIVYASTRPELVNEFSFMAQKFYGEQPSVEELVELINPFLSQPVVILSALTFMAVIVPLIEEAIKPVGVWLLAGKNLTPAAGFAAGALSGAGYALFESLALTSGGAQWSYLVLVRIGTAVIHITTTALSGWALALAWRDGRYLRLGLTYLGVVLVHGLWNGVTVLNAFNELSGVEGLQVSLPQLTQWGNYIAPALVALSAGGFITLLVANRRLRREQPAESEESLWI